MKKQAFVHRNLPRLLLQAREAVMTHTRPSLREHGLSDQQWRVLRVLGEHANSKDGAEGVETGRVAREAFLLGPSLTGVLTRMEEAGWIQRERMEHDQRRVKVTVTAATKKLGKSMAPMIEREYLELENKVGVKQLQQVYDALDTLLQHLDRPEEISD